MGNREDVQSVSRVRNRQPSPESPERLRASAKTAIVADARPLDRVPADFNTEAYDRIADNPFFEVAENPLSTFSIDVDTASYANLRRFLNKQHASAQGCGPNRGDGELFLLRLPGSC